jgi:hypothetical protein
MLISEQKINQGNSHLILSLEIVFCGKLILDVQNHQATLKSYLWESANILRGKKVLLEFRT